MSNNNNDPFSSSRGFGEKYRQTAINLLRDTIDLLNTHQIQHSLIAGTLLGKVRHNDFIPWDDDMDMIVSADIIDKLPELRKSYPNLVFIERQQFLVKVCYRTGDPIKNHGLDRFMHSPATDRYTFPFIDLFVYKENPAATTLHFFEKEWDAAQFIPFKKTQFCGLTVCIPHTPHYFLAKNYGPDYMRVIKSSNWDHKTEHVIKEVALLQLDNELPYYF